MSPRRAWPRTGVRTQLPVVFRKASSTEFQPTDISGLALWLDASDSATLFQDAAATTPATAASDPVGAWLDKSGNARHATQSTAANRPTIGAIASARGLVFDSTDSLLSTASMSDLIGSAASSPAMTIAFIATNASGTAGFSLGSDNATNGRLFVSNSFDGAGTSYFDVAGTAGGRLSYSLPSSSQTAASVYVLQRSDSSMIVRRNAATIASKSDASQTFSATSAKLSIGQAIGLTGFSGTCGSVLCYPSALTASQYQRLERFLATRWNITLAPQVSNADAQDWVNRVYANGGTVTSATASAVNTFCNAIDAAGIRDRFYRMGIFAGSNLNAAFVPLYRGPSLGGTQYGKVTDENNGPFVSGDFTSDGLLGAAGKFLKTGLSPDTVGVATGHMSLIAKGAASSAQGLAIGARNSGASQRYVISTANRNAYQGDANTDFYSEGNWGGSSALVYQSTGSAARPGGQYLVTRTASNRIDWYLNGQSVANSQSSVTPGATSNEFYVMGINNNESAFFFGATVCRGYSIGLSLTAAQALAFSQAVADFNTAIGRT